MLAEGISHQSFL